MHYQTQESAELLFWNVDYKDSFVMKTSETDGMDKGEFKKKKKTSLKKTY